MLPKEKNLYLGYRADRNDDNPEIALYTDEHIVLNAVIGTYLYREPAEGEYGNHDDDHSGNSLLSPPALGRRWLSAWVHSFPQSHQHQHVQDAYDSKRYRVRREEEEYLKCPTNIIVIAVVSNGRKTDGTNKIKNDIIIR